ncbi:tRNA (adenosine(37)-N6)-threonylcarbamoyltransferase complex transferase subunit TsaD [Candidatus Curtissbacteria bacterium RIFCSPHIGHO2_01_FULL_41_44]|nr:MAG: tRNA (adenosine(37)-N6)-threonylcarbamoyltransferase complex transferase subunit TsaD [Candidatus Curtissbacteria bacterium RIFCSPHIGHO2_01_FULL_41_44]
MLILGIESTCDETGAGIVRDGRRILANVVSSSAKLHQKYQGVVPEIAAREQVRVIVPVLNEALRQAQSKLNEIDAIAVAYGPGFVGSLLVGVETAKTLALVWKKPLTCVNHLIGHVYANWLTVNREPKTVNLPQFPIVALIVSGGHTDLILMKDHGKYGWLGGTRDDAAGEVFDKVARVLGLGYPGGDEIERAAQQLTADNLPSDAKALAGSQLTFNFPRPMIGDNTFDFSFSGLKTSVVNYVSQVSDVCGQVPAIAVKFQDAIVDVLVKKTLRAAETYSAKSVVVGGGVAANEYLRDQFSVINSQLGIPVFSPSKGLATDNGAMIAAAAFYLKKRVDSLKLQADPGLNFNDI